MTIEAVLSDEEIRASWLELHLQASPDGEVTATVPVRWKIKPELVKYLENRAYSNPHVVIVVRSVGTYKHGNAETPDYTPTGVYVVPLSQELQYVDFHRAGDNEITAYVMIAEGERGAKMAKNWTREPYDWRDERPFLEYHNTFVSHVRVAVTVIVPQEMFAKPPAAWRKNLVNQFYKDKADDQCNFRGYFLGALVKSVPVQLWGLLARPVLAIVALWGGFSNLHWKNLFALNPHELAYEFNGDETWWLPEAGKKVHEYTGKERVKFAFNPVMLTVATVVGAIVGLIIWGILLLFANPNIWPLLADTVIGSIACMCFLTFTAEGTKEVEKSWFDRRRAAKRQHYYAELLVMAENQDATPSLQALPSNKQTVYLRFRDVKTRVCKPFIR